MAQMRVIAKFDQCPLCRSKRRFVKELVEKEIGEGRLPIGSELFLQTIGKVIRTQNAPVLIGMKSPAALAFLDACSKCGAVYTVMQAVTEAEAGIGTSQTMPNAGKQPLGR